jgi:hypothetical protein
MASDYPLDVGERYARLFRELGARSSTGTYSALPSWRWSRPD